MSLFSSTSGIGSLVRGLSLGCGAAVLLVAGLAFADSYDLQPWSGVVPGGALEGGAADDGSPLYVCVVESWGGQHPGNLSDDGVCQVAWGGQGHSFDEGFSVLVGPAPTGEWSLMIEAEVPEGAVRAGDDGGPIYVCRFDVEGGLYPGKLTDDGWCYVAVGGVEEVATGGFEVLVE